MALSIFRLDWRLGGVGLVLADDLNRLTNFQRGTLNSTRDQITPVLPNKNKP
jgi:hypothetical protein